MAEKLNKATGPTAVVIPMKGQTPPRRPGPPDPFIESLRNPGPGLEAFRKAFLKDLKPEIKVEVLDVGHNEPPYVETVLSKFDEMMKG